jgi:hypothetical protein
MNECPKCHYTRTPIDQQVNLEICPSCGIVYRKWIAQHQAPELSACAVNAPPTHDNQHTFHEIVLSVPNNIEPHVFYARCLTLIGFAIWGFYFISGGVSWETIGGSFLHSINLPFHEFGHLFFSPFGNFMMILGGSLFQVSMPLGLMCIFIWKNRDNFAASIMLWWSGQNFIDVSPYIQDAQYRLLPLVGGGSEESHDWGNLLSQLGSLESAHTIASISFSFGAILMAIGLAWGAYILRIQKRNLI